MFKNWAITLILILIVCVLSYFLYSKYNTVETVTPPPVTEKHVNPNISLATSTKPAISEEKQEIIDAIMAKMNSAMNSKNAKKIRDYSLSLYSTQSEKDAVNKLTDSQILQSGQIYNDLRLADSISIALANLPDSAWNITGTSATLTQAADGTHKAIFTATKVNGIWK